jgi:CorA-like Mg2+ transporter protein
MARSQYKWTLPVEITARLGSESWGAQRAIFEVQQLLLVLHAPPKADSNERESEVFFRQPSGKWLYKGVEHGERSLTKFLDDYRALLAALETRYEKAMDIDALFAVIDSLIPLARSTANTKLALQSARESLGNDAFIIDMRDRSVDIARGFEVLLADARLALNYRVARSGEEQIRAAEAGNRAQQKLNILAAMAFPLMSVSTVFGMNLHSGLENQHFVAFWLVFLGGVALGLFVKRWVIAVKPQASDGKPQARGKQSTAKK